MPVIGAPITSGAASGPWITVEELAAYCPGIAVAVDEQAVVNVVSELLFALSGAQFGSWTDVVRPQVHHPDCERFRGCGCCSTELVLDGPVRSVTEVLVDGAVLPATSYALYDARRLVRLDGKAWPCGQHLSDPITEAGTMRVTYTRGDDVPLAGKEAAKELACQIALASSGSADCRLPQRVQSVARQGVTMLLLDPQEFLASGRTGLYLVDLFLSTFNPGGRRRRATVSSPDLLRGARL